jgi:phosphatidylserine/phosphatidylglycerophosphate/cardiolipin synthase-like enzyme
MARGKVLLRYDHRHAAAHNKIMVIDAGLEQCAVITGSYNFSTAAQHRNAENALILRANPPLCTAYYDNWRRHYAHASIRR